MTRAATDMPTAVNLNGAMWANIFNAVPANLVGVVRNARHSVMTFNQPATEQLILREVINLMLVKMDSKRKAIQDRYRQAISALETEFGYTYGYRVNYNWEGCGG